MRRLATLDELVGFSIVAATVMSGVAGAVFAGVVFPFVEATSISPLQGSVGLVLGVLVGPLCGLVSLVWLVPILRGHVTSQSLVRMLMITGVIGTLAGCLHPLLGLLFASVAQITGALLTRHLGGKPRVGYCVRCDYDVRQASTDICPECGGVHTPG